MKRLIAMLIYYAAILIIVGYAVYTVFRVDVDFLFYAGAVLLAAFVIAGVGISICKFKMEEKSSDGKRDEHDP